ncbi:hypothetical protein GDO81_023434 [Engystomops pustulosus]|uniref:Uncharacterized protein n=1 Tax=Engystomops pustulosus TaxID=76066 RepID=A0AAV6YLE2_ENGPU|nr:hypothetical protein GDO81_023434 [Engystomops pustulosus]
MKVAFPIAITSDCRIGEIQALSCKEPFLTVLDDRIILKLDPLFLPKVVSEFHKNQDIDLPSFCANSRNSRERECNTLDVRRAVIHLS